MTARASLWTLIFGLTCTSFLHGQAAETVYCKQPAFRIPFQIEPGEQARLKEVQLYLSDDQAKTWRPHKTVGPEQRFFSFKAEKDGTYLFLVRTLDNDGKYYPAALEGAAPGLRVIVDTQAPVATMRALTPRGDQVGIEWEVRDDNLDLATLQIEYRAQGTGDWLPLAAESLSIGRKYWTPAARGPLEVRLRVRDRAENQGTAYLFLPVGGNPGAAADAGRPNADNGNARTAGAGNPPMKVVNSAEISLDYKLEDVGPSGVSLVELWYTRDGRTWQRHSEDPNKAPPYRAKLPGEGVYGLTLVVKSGVGLGDRPPQAGDAAQMWIEVDTTKPVVQINTVEAGRGADLGNLTVLWKAEDKNMAPQPITIYYAENADGPWTPMAGGLENTGRYVWRIPKDVPFRFHVRVEAIDRGGNIGRAETKQQVIVDLAQPRGRLIGVDGVQSSGGK